MKMDIITKRSISLWLIALGLWLGACAGLASQNRENALPPPTPAAGETASISTLLPTNNGAEAQATTIPAGPADLPQATATETIAPRPTDTPAASPSPSASQELHFAVIGDFGEGSQGEADVATLVHTWNPDFVITVGDDNYPDGAAATIDDHIGKYYHDFIAPYRGSFGKGADQNRFFPTLGNHDWLTASAQPYLDYFTLPGKERYYDFTWGPVHFFAIDSDSHEPDGVAASSPQAAWLKEALSKSTSRWNVVYFHHAPFSSGLHGATTWMRWPFKEWGASVVLTGHDHLYERLQEDGLAYFIDGLGGGPIYQFQEIVPGSQKRYNGDFGAMRITTDLEHMVLEFINRKGKVIDSTELK